MELKVSSNYRVMFCVLFAILTGGLLRAVIMEAPVRTGDGHEYELVVHAMARHGSPAVTLEDVTDLRTRIVARPVSSGWTPQILDRIAETMRHQGREEGGLFHAGEGQYYGWHFWLYAAFVSPVHAMLDAFDRNIFRSMQIANAVVIIFVLGWLWFFMPANRHICFWTGTLYLLGGSLFYLRWTHPEVFVTGLVTLGMAALYSSAWRTALLAFGLASMQMVSLAPLMLLVPARLLWAIDGSFRERLAVLRGYWRWLAAFVLPLIPPLFFYAYFGVYNLIASAGVAQPIFVTWGRLWSFWADLNQGAIVGLPWLVLLGIAAVLQAWYVPARRGTAEWFWAVLAAMIVCLPLLSQVNWNSGQAIFSRYALIAGAPLVVWGGRYLASLHLPSIAACFVVSVLACFNAAYVGWHNSNNHIQHKPWVAWLWSHAPAYYNPEPEIFIERTIGKEVGYITPTVWQDDSGWIRKILLPATGTGATLTDVCAGSRLVDENGEIVKVSHLTARQYGWGYLNGRFHCAPHTTY